MALIRKRIFSGLVFATVVLGVCIQGQAQMGSPPPELDLLKKDVGEWTCEIKSWSMPGADPQVSKGKESSRMMGGFWMITNFEGKMFGQDFIGHGTYGYDVEKKKYVGTWIDSLGPSMMQTVGTYDKESETMTAVGDSIGPDGSPYTFTSSTCYKDGKRVMTMWTQPKGSGCLLYTSPSPRDQRGSRMPSSA